MHSLFACGGVLLKNGWLYDGLYWERTSRPMNVGRDRPACSLMCDPETGKVKVLVAGGCDGWCVENPALASAESWDPDTGEWTPVADMPTPLSSANVSLH